MNEAAVKHHGILGQRWGRRRPVGPNGLVRTSGDYLTSRQLMSKPLPTLSNSELKRINERLQLEQKYTQLNPELAYQGRRLGGRFLKKYGDHIVSGTAKFGYEITTEMVKKKINASH